MSWQEQTHLHGKIKSFYREEDFAWFEWCPNTLAKNTKGAICHWEDEDAYYFSLLGAIYKLYLGTTYWKTISLYLGEIFKSAFWEGPLIAWEDATNRTWEDVLEFMEKHNL